MLFRVHTLLVGELNIPLGNTEQREPIHAWYATDGTTKVLIDSGMPSAAEVKARLRVEASGGGQNALQTQLAKVGAAPEEIQFVVLTHLHFDHAWNLEMFPSACVVVQRDEVFHAIDPAPTQRIYYLRETTLNLLQRKRPKQLRLIDGDVELVSGVKLLKVPGHTPGMQVAIIETDRGRVALVSDCGDNYACWYPADPRAAAFPLRYMAGEFMPGPIRSESEKVYTDGMRRIMAEADIVVPAHDDRIPRAIPDEWFAVPPGSPAGAGRAPHEM